MAAAVELRVSNHPISDDEFQGVTLLWDEGYQDDRVISIPRYIDQHSSRLKKRYLKFIYDLGETEITKKKLSEYFNYPDGYSIWWASAIVEKSPLKSPEITDCIKLFALGELIELYKPKVIYSILRKKNINEAIKWMCEKRHISYKPKYYFIGLCIEKPIYKSFPHVIQSLAFLIRYFYLRFNFTFNTNQVFQGGRSVFIISYFAHLSEQSCLRGIFYSYQWGELIHKFLKKNIFVNIAQIYLSTSIAKNSTEAIGIAKKFNKNSYGKSSHFFIDSFFKPSYSH